MELIKASEKKLFIREFVGECELGTGEKIELSRTLNSSPVIEFENGDKVLFSWKYLIDLAIKFKEEMGKR